MTEQERAEVPLASSLLAKAVKEINESDAEGAVGEIKTLVKLVIANNKKMEVLQKNSTELMGKIQKLSAAGGLKAEAFAG